MQFANSLWLMAGAAACGLLGFGFYHFQKKGQAALKTFAAGHLLARLTESVSPGRRMVKRILLLAAVGAIFVALARPQAGYEWKEVKRKGIDILMAVDTSRSMLATDVRPNRLERSKLGIMDFVSRLEGDRVGLVPFAGTAFLMCPLTLDYDAFRQSLKAIDTQIIPQGGTDMASAIREAEAAFSNDANHKILVLVTDGEDLEGEALSAARQAAEKGMTIYTVGVGTPAGELIPLSRNGQDGRFLKDAGGNMVKSRLDEKMLGEIAQVTGGQYEPLGQQAEGLDAIYQQKLSLVPKHELAERMQRVPVERFEWPLLLAVVLLVLEFAVSDRRPRRKRTPVIQTADRRILTVARGLQAGGVVLLAGAVILVAQIVHASPQQAEKAYKSGDYAAAVQGYTEAAKEAPDNTALRFNAGTAAYKEKKYEDALGAFQATLSTQDLPLQNKAYYNMGNTLYRMGEGTEKQDPQNTIHQWEAAIQAYDGALKLNPADADARFNREYVKKKLEELKKQQKQDPKKNCGCNKNKDQNKEQSKNQDKNQKDNQQTGKDQNNQNKGENSDRANNQKDEKKNNAPDKDPQQRAGSQPDRNQKEKDKQKPAQAKAGGKDKANGNPSGKDRASGKPEQMKAGNKTPASSVRAGRQRKPGQMSEEQARNLLDSLKGEDQAVPMIAGNRGQGKADQEKNRRDW